MHSAQKDTSENIFCAPHTYDTTAMSVPGFSVRCQGDTPVTKSDNDGETPDRSQLVSPEWVHNAVVFIRAGCSLIRFLHFSQTDFCKSPNKIAKRNKKLPPRYRRLDSLDLIDPTWCQNFPEKTNSGLNDFWVALTKCCGKDLQT